MAPPTPYLQAAYGQGPSNHRTWTQQEGGDLGYLPDWEELMPLQIGCSHEIASPNSSMTVDEANPDLEDFMSSLMSEADELVYTEGLQHAPFSAGSGVSGMGGSTSDQQSSSWNGFTDCSHSRTRPAPYSLPTIQQRPQSSRHTQLCAGPDMQEWAQGRPARQLGSYEAPLYAHSAMTSTRTVTTAPAHLQAMLGGRSQGAYWTPPGPFTAGHPVRHQAPGLYDSLRSALGPRFASADTPLPNTLTPRPAATDNPLHDTLAQRFAAMEVSPHGATPEEEQAGLPALMAAGLELQDPEPEPAKRKGGRKKAPDPPLDMDPKLRRRKIKNRESAARSKLKQKAEQAAARAAGKSIPKKQKLAATAKPTKRSASGARSAGRKRKAEPGPNATQHTLSAARTDMHPEVHPGQVFDGVPIGLPEAPIMGPPAQLLGPPMAPGPQAPCMERHQAYTDDQLLAWMRCLLDEAL